MRIPSKIALALSAFVIALPMAFGQDAAPAQAATPAANQYQHQPFHHRSTRSQQTQRHGQWNHRNYRNHRNFRSEWRHHGRMHRHFMLAALVKNPQFRERVGITPEQAKTIETKTFNFRKSMIGERAALQVKHLELSQLLSNQTPDRNAVNQKLQEISNARLAQSKAMIDFRLDMRAALTPEQWQKMRQMRNGFRHHDFGSHGSSAPTANTSSPATQG